MTDAEYRTQKKRLDALRKRWYFRLGLGWWKITYRYVKDEFTVDGHLEPGTLATCEADWRYLKARIDWNMLRVADHDDDYLEEAFVHEHMHLFVDELREGVEPGFDHLVHEERVCTQLARAFIWTRQAKN